MLYHCTCYILLHDVEVDIFLPLPGKKSSSKGRPPNREGLASRSSRFLVKLRRPPLLQAQQLRWFGNPSSEGCRSSHQSPRVPIMVQIQPRFMVCHCPLLERFHLWHHLFWSLVQWFSTRLRQRQGDMGVVRKVWQTSRRIENRPHETIILHPSILLKCCVLQCFCWLGWLKMSAITMWFAIFIAFYNANCWNKARQMKVIKHLFCVSLWFRASGPRHFINRPSGTIVFQ